MPRSRPSYPPEFKKQMVEMVRSGRSAESLAKEFEPSAQSIRTWVKQADLDEGLREDGLTTDETLGVGLWLQAHTSIAWKSAAGVQPGR